MIMSDRLPLRYHEQVLYKQPCPGCGTQTYPRHLDADGYNYKCACGATWHYRDEMIVEQWNNHIEHNNILQRDYDFVTRFLEQS